MSEIGTGQCDATYENEEAVKYTLVYDPSERRMIGSYTLSKRA